MTLQEEMVMLWKAIRNAWKVWSINRRGVLDSAAIKLPKLKKDGTPSKVMVWHWKCAHCGEMVTDRQVDHIDPVGAFPKSEADLPYVVARLFCSIDNLQVLCKSCHAKKTAREATERAKKKKERLKDV